MDVIINKECELVPEKAKLILSNRQMTLNLLASLGYDSQNPPLADLLRTSHHLEGEWVVLSPIHWQVTHNDAMFSAIGHDLESETASKICFQLLSEHLQADHMQLFYHDASTWLLNVTDKPPLHAKPVHSMENQSLMPELAQLDPSMYWQKFFTECQMFFATHPDSLINGVWPWGAGQLLAKKSMAICADEHFISMAQICSSQVAKYNPSIKLGDFQILLLNDLSTLGLQHQQALKKSSVCWYWINTAYTLARPNWLIRIWRHLTHGH